MEICPGEHYTMRDEKTISECVAPLRSGLWSQQEVLMLQRSANNLLLADCMSVVDTGG